MERRYPSVLLHPVALPIATALAAVALLATAAFAAASLARLATGGDNAAGGDFVSIVAAGSLVDRGQAGRLYDGEAQREAQERVAPGRLARINPYVLPPFLALVAAPVSHLPFGAAFAAWATLNLLLLGGLLVLLRDQLHAVDPRLRRVFLAVAASSLPVVAGLIFGQVDLLVFAGLLLGYVLLRAERPYAAGAALALALVKPHLLGGVVLLLVAGRAWRPLAALAAVSALLLITQIAALGPQLSIEHLAALVRLPGGGGGDANVTTMPNWRGFVASVSGRDVVWLWAPGLGAIASAALPAAWRTWRGHCGVTHAQSYALAVILPLLVSPHLHTQSLALLFIPLALALRAAATATSAGSDVDRRALVALLLSLYAALFALWVAGALFVALGGALIAALFVGCVSRWPSPAEAPAALPVARAA